MRSIIFTAGTSIDNAARALVSNAPARGEFNGIAIRARYATTNPRDIVARYHIMTELRGIVWQASPEGRRIRAEQERRTAEAQSTMDRLVDLLPDLPMTEPASVLAWVREAAGPADRIGVRWDRDAVKAHFAANGWLPGVNCGEAFNGDDARNFAGWIVGQWLKYGFPGVDRFVDDWRAKFGGAS